jgi:hypothetical protein
MGWMETDERLIMMGEFILDLNLLEKHADISECMILELPPLCARKA